MHNLGASSECIVSKATRKGYVLESPGNFKKANAWVLLVGWDLMDLMGYRQPGHWDF